MFPIVRQRPSLSPLMFVRGSAGGVLPEPLDGGNCTFYFKGRNAIWHAAGALKLLPGDTILLPSYHCGAELDAILKTGANVDFYRVDRSARIDAAHLESLIREGARAVLITHYFGFPDPRLAEVLALCRARNLFVVEDCAHALYSRSEGELLGTFGNVAAFSLFKSLPAPHGGAVRINDPSLSVEEPQVEPPIGEGYDVVHWSMEAHLRSKLGVAGECANKVVRQLRRIGLEPLRIFEKRIQSRARSGSAAVWSAAGAADSPITFDVATKDWSASALAMFIAGHCDHARIFRRRAENFRFLAGELRGLNGLELLYSELAEGVCPLGLPMIAQDAPGLHAFLGGWGIVSDLFWKTPHPKSPEARFADAHFLTTHVVMLPVHQDVESETLRFMAEAVRKWARR